MYPARKPKTPSLMWRVLRAAGWVTVLGGLVSVGQGFGVSVVGGAFGSEGASTSIDASHVQGVLDRVLAFVPSAGLDSSSGGVAGLPGAQQRGFEQAATSLR